MVYGPKLFFLVYVYPLRINSGQNENRTEEAVSEWIYIVTEYDIFHHISEALARPQWYMLTLDRTKILVH
jgi:hypothetical protein